MLLAFDTHLFYKKLQSADFSDKQAEAITELVQESQNQAFQEISKSITSQLEDIKNTLKSFNTRLDSFETKLDSLQEDVRKQELSIEKIRSELRVEIRQTKVDTIKWVVTLFLAQTGVIAALVKIL